jgi:basic amino acid/polyamine antiporter, APA family
MLKQILRKKSIDQLGDGDGTAEGPKLNQILTARDVFNHGVAAIIGAGIFVLTGVAAANFAGPGIILSFVLAGICCGLVALAYAELASMIPISGSAYTYAYATLGEMVAWIIGWDLLLEYAVGSSAVAVGWSAYLQHVLKDVGITLPEYLSHAPASLPWSAVLGAVGMLSFGVMGLYRWYKGSPATLGKNTLFGIAGGALTLFGLHQGWVIVSHLTSVDLPAFLIIAFINYWLLKGVNHTAKMTAIFVVIKVVVILLFIALGITHINTANYTPFLPFGWQGVFTGAAIVFFAFIGFDAVTTLAEECKDPKKDMPRGVLGSLAVCTVLYVLVAAIMTGAIVYSALNTAAPVATVLQHIGINWAVPIISIGAIAGLTSVLIVLLFGQSRIMMRMSKDGLISPIFGRIHPTYRTPTWAIGILGALAAATAGLLPIGELAELSNIGTLAAFVIVCVGVIVLRKTEPNRARKFRCPGSPWLPALGALMCIALMCSLPMLTWVRFMVWMLIGVVIYVLYGRKHSRLNQSSSDTPGDTK